jgi:hypothetical protein
MNGVRTTTIYLDVANEEVDSDSVRGPNGSDPGVGHLLDEVQLLHERLHRVTVALAITEDLLADTFERLANQPSARCTQHRLEAKRARASASECRMFAARLDELEPKGEEPPRPPMRLV